MAAHLVWPLPNVWLGVSVEDQRRADERIPDLLATPAAVRFVSIEPLLGPIDLTRIPRVVEGQTVAFDALAGKWHPTDCGHDYGYVFERIDWAIVGGESGPGWRDCPIEAFYSLRDQCAAAGVAFFEKQMPGKRPIPADLLIREFPHA